MKTSVIVSLAVTGVIASATLVSAVSYVSAYNGGNRAERRLVASQDSCRNILSQYGLKVVESMQVTDAYKDDVIKLTEAAIQGRYGEDGAKAMFQMVTEQNPSLSPELYTQIQRTIESGRNDFETCQKEMIDIKRVYETDLGSFWRGTWLSVAGYPMVDLKDFAIVSTARADGAFETKQDEPIKLR